MVSKKQKPIIYIFCEWKTEKKYFIQLSRILHNDFKIITDDLKWGTVALSQSMKHIYNKLDIIEYED